MRVWDVHPGYLSRGNLLGQHAEIHALLKVIEASQSGSKKGYQAHPETLRWKDHTEKLIKRHELTVKEMRLRGYGHASPCDYNLHEVASPPPFCFVDHPAEQLELLREKYRKRETSGRIPLPVRGSDFWAHHKYAVMARGYDYYKEVQSYLKQKKDLPIRQETALLEKILFILEKPVSLKALQNTVHHLWGYFKEVATLEEKEKYLQCSQEELPTLVNIFYTMARNYQKEYLLQSTVFADFL